MKTVFTIPALKITLFRVNVQCALERRGIECGVDHGAEFERDLSRGQASEKLGLRIFDALENGGKLK